MATYRNVLQWALRHRAATLGGLGLVFVVTLLSLGPIVSLGWFVSPDQGFFIMQLEMPCVLAAGKGLNTPRYPTFPEIVKSRKKEIRIVGVESLNISAPASSVERVHLAPVVEKRSPKEISGSTLSIAEQLFTILKDKARVI